MAKRTRRTRSSAGGFPNIRPCPGDPPEVLFSIPRRRTNMYFPELLGLSRRINAMFARVVRDGLRRRRRQFGLPNLQFTIALVDGGAYLTYADPVKKTRRRGK